MNEADQIRARLDEMAAEEAAGPSPVEDPVAHDGPDECPECGSTTFTYEEDWTEYHGCRLSMGPVWRCTGCKWGERAAA